MNICDVNHSVRGHRRPFRKGRGPGSGNGKTAGRGNKGQLSRSGTPQRVLFDGGGMAMFRRIPKRGFTNSFATPVACLNLAALDRAFDEGADVTIEALRERRLIPRRARLVKILGQGELTKRLNISAHRFSESARAKIQQAGGSLVELAAGPRQPRRSKGASNPASQDS
jgi:large subunit ribosomal protein L15